ncbi:hypothetical protein [Nitrosomonas mobilis]|uniref:Uncharacterized protein n=1 Tax=Nitrosomonas mobilis TaxID=51642 RepID=A0A1G5SIB0_9PROT|nr:hypothetical protein [Nitrosomonas mobilis]SCZ86109.1 conserved hypothetical protein [Nitrosomonas mobilis]HNO75411.1 hypothetical protein [Nitrosomonas mobilis]
MQDDYRKIIIKRVIHEQQNGMNGDNPFKTSPVNRWVFYLTLIPVVIVVMVLGAFFFSVVLALFVAVATVIGARIWWLRRKLRRAMSETAESTNGGIIEDAQIIDEVKRSDQTRYRD